MNDSSKASGLRDLLGSTSASSDLRAATTNDPPIPPAPEPTGAVSASNKQGAADAPPKKRSNMTLSENLVERIAAARDEHRWTLVRLFETALDSWNDISDVDAGHRLAHTGPRHRQQGVTLSERHFAQLSHLGEAWRMNRSEVATVVLEHRLDELGL